MIKNAGENSENAEVIEFLQGLAKHMDERFDQVDGRFRRIDEKFEHVDAQFEAVFKRLDEIHYTVSGHEQRLSILEDRMRMMATKIGLDFHQTV